MKVTVLTLKDSSTLKSQSIPELHTPRLAQVQQLSVIQDYYALHPDSVHAISMCQYGPLSECMKQ